MWYALVQNEQLGPMSAPDLVELFQKSIISEETYIWAQHMSDWLAFEDVSEFSHLFEPEQDENEQTLAMSSAALGDFLAQQDVEGEDDAATLMIAPGESDLWLDQLNGLAPEPAPKVAPAPQIAPAPPRLAPAPAPRQRPSHRSMPPPLPPAPELDAHPIGPPAPSEPVLPPEPVADFPKFDLPHTPDVSFAPLDVVPDVTLGGGAFIDPAPAPAPASARNKGLLIGFFAGLAILGIAGAIWFFVLHKDSPQSPPITKKTAVTKRVALGTNNNSPKRPPPVLVDAGSPQPDAAPAQPDAAPAQPDAAPPKPDAAPPKPDAKPKPKRVWKPRPKGPDGKPVTVINKGKLPTRLSRKDIQAVISARAGALKSCRGGDKNLPNTISVSITIKRSGAVQSARLGTAKVRGTPAQSCIEKQVRGYKFKPFNGDPMRITLPLKL